MKLMLLQRFVRWRVRRILRKKAPDTIPRSGEKGRTVNCYSIILTKDGDPWVLVDGAEPAHLKGREWNGEVFADQIKVPWNDILWNQIQITHYFGLVEFAYQDFGDYLRIGATQYYRLLL